MWFVGSRFRPHLVAKMFDIAPPSTLGAVVIDHDQVELYRNVKLPSGWRFEVVQRPGNESNYVQKNNEMFARYPRLGFYGCINDDHVPLTKGWDTKLIERATAWGIAFADDMHTRRATCIALGGEFVRACGFIFCPVMRHYYCDDGVELMCKELKLAGMQKDIFVEHRHLGYKKNPGKLDDCYRSRPKQMDEKPVWLKWRAEEWPALKTRLIAALNAAA